MNFIGKLAIGAASGVISFVIWGTTLVLGTFLGVALINIFSSQKNFSKSRGSMFDMMHVRSTMNNPLQNFTMSDGTLSFLLMIAAGIALIVLIRAVRQISVRMALAVSMQTVAASLLLGAVVLAASHFFLVGEKGTATLVFFGGMVISGLLGGGARVIGKGARESLA